MGTIRTLDGPIDPDELGVTYVHEHLLTDPPNWRIQEDPDYVLDSVDKMVQELESFRREGGETLVDCTAIDYGRDARGMLKIDRQTDVKLIGLTGFNRGDYGDDEIQQLSTRDMIDWMMKDVREGMDDTEARPGLLKFGTGYNVIRPIERRFIESVTEVHKRTGLPVLTHTSMGTMGIEQVDAFRERGGEVENLLLSHVDQNLDGWYYREILDRGASILFDGFAKIKYAPDQKRVEILRELVDEGYEKRLFISGDMGRRSYLKAYGGGPGFSFLLGKLVPRLLDQGFTEDHIRTFFETNPRRFLTVEE